MMKRWVGAVVVLALSAYLVLDLGPGCDTESLRGARVLITGASSGIGEQLSGEFARHGARLCLTARRRERLEEVAVRCRSLGSASTTVLPGNMEDIEFARRVVSDAVSDMGGLDYLVLNHVGLSPMGWWSGDVRDTDRLEASTRLNFLSYVSAASEALVHLERSGGKILVVSSICGKIPMPLVSAYASSKFALEGFFGSLTRELSLRESRISVTIADLGFIDTDTAVSQVKDMVTLAPAPVGPCASALLLSVCARQPRVAHPGSASAALLLHRWIPQSLWAITRSSYNRSAMADPPVFRASVG